MLAHGIRKHACPGSIDNREFEATGTGLKFVEHTKLETAETTDAPIDKPQFTACAYFVGERINTKAVTSGRRLSARPLTLALGSGEVAIVFRWGAVVFLDTGSEEIETFLDTLRPFVERPYERPEMESVTVRIVPHASEGVDVGTVTLHDGRVERLQTLGYALGKTVALAQYEADIATSFNEIEPFASHLEQFGRTGREHRELLSHIGRSLLNEQKLLGRVEVTEKPDVLWENPQLESLYVHLEAEYELRERAELLDRKLELIARSARTVLDLLQDSRSLRVEWYIVILIIVEIVLLVYDMFLGS